MKRLAAACTAIALAGCSVNAISVPRPIPADLELGRLGEKTNFETGRDSEPAAPATTETAASPDADSNSQHEPDKGQRARVGVFWAGIALTAAGGGSTIAMAVTGEATQKQLTDGYADGSLTRAREEQLTGRGELVNKLAVASATLALIGVALAAIAYGVDYTRCGKLAKRRKKCREASVSTR
jgi:hypothetical protein